MLDDRQTGWILRIRDDLKEADNIHIVFTLTQVAAALRKGTCLALVSGSLFRGKAVTRN